MRYVIFPTPLVLHVYGQDSKRYLNARLSNDIAHISQSICIPAAILTAQGKTEGYFYTLQDADGYLLYASSGAQEQVLAAFKRFLVADRVTVDVTSEATLLFLSGSAEEVASVVGAAVPDSRFHCTQQNDYSIVRSDRLGDSGYDILCGTETAAHTIRSALAAAGATELPEAAFEALRMQHGEPTFPHELNEQNLFAEAELSHSVSFSKGCYVGQEALEMLAARGKLPARIVRISTDGQPLSVGDALYADAEKKSRIGNVLSTSRGENGMCYGFARIKAALSDLKQAVTENDVSCSITARTAP